MAFNQQRLIPIVFLSFCSSKNTRLSAFSITRSFNTCHFLSPRPQFFILQLSRAIFFTQFSRSFLAIKMITRECHIRQALYDNDRGAWAKKDKNASKEFWKSVKGERSPPVNINMVKQNNGVFTSDSSEIKSSIESHFGEVFIEITMPPIVTEQGFLIIKMYIKFWIF